MSRLRWPAPLLALALAVACQTGDPVTCPADPPRVRISPDTVSLGVGQATTPRAQAFVCGGGQETPFIGRWRAADSMVARVDSLTGVVTARAPGSTAIYGQYFSGSRPVGGTYDSVLVTVR